MGNYVALFSLPIIILFSQQFKKNFHELCFFLHGEKTDTYLCLHVSINKNAWPTPRERRCALPVLILSDSEIQPQWCSCLWLNTVSCVRVRMLLFVSAYLGILRWNARQSSQHSGSIQKQAVKGWTQKTWRAGSSWSNAANRAREEKPRCTPKKARKRFGEKKAVGSTTEFNLTVWEIKFICQD